MQAIQQVRAPSTENTASPIAGFWFGDSYQVARVCCLHIRFRTNRYCNYQTSNPGPVSQ